MEPSRRQDASKITMRLAGLLLAASVASAAACSHASSEDRAARHAAARFGVPAGSLRVTNQSDLTGERHDFLLVTRAGLPPLVVVVPARGEPFDGDSKGAFDRVARGEDAVRRLSRIGAERVALWFAALGGGRCPMPASDDAHFARVERLADGVRISYPAGNTAEFKRTCAIELAADGSLRDARLVEQKASAAGASSRPWRSGG